MAKKTKDEVKNKLISLARLQYERLIRNPNYHKDFKRYKNKCEKLYKIYGEKDKLQCSFLVSKEQERLRKKYRIELFIDPSKPFEVKDKSNIFSYLTTSGCPAMLDFSPLGVEYQKAKTNDEQDKIILNRALEEDRFARIQIDTGRDKEVILLYVEWFIDWIKERKNKFGIGKYLDKSIQLDNIDRYFKVFDFRNQKPPLKYKIIALNLINGGYLRNKSLEQTIEVVKKDYRVAFREVFGIPYKRHNKELILKSNFKGCKKCSKFSICKEPCADMDYLLSEQEVKQKHYIGKKDAGSWNS